MEESLELNGASSLPTDDEQNSFGGEVVSGFLRFGVTRVAAWASLKVVCRLVLLHCSL